VATQKKSGRKKRPVKKPNKARSSEELRNFGAGLLMAQENERRNLALQLHDDLGQRLALLELNVETLEKGDSSRTQWKEQLHSVHQQITLLSKSLRRIAYQLHPATLEHLGLAAAVESYVREFVEREEIQVLFRASNMPANMDPQTALCLYRIVQEGLRNIAQHAGAKSAEVSLWATDSKIHLKIKDSGSGSEVSASKSKKGLGLLSMMERARACGGVFKINARPGVGTEVLVAIPAMPGRKK
jgi:two-component system, chemotaxis family, CheB/CheR fusion protein